MTKIYRLSAPALERDTNANLMRSLTFQILVMMGPVFYMLFTGQLSSSGFMIAFTAFWTLMTTFIVWRVIRTVRKKMVSAIESYELTIDDIQIVRVQRDCPTVTIPRHTVRKIAERRGQGFRIETSDSQQNIWVPRELESYEEVKNFLLRSTAAEVSTMQHPLLQTYVVAVFSAVGIYVVFYSRQRMVVGLLGLALLGVYGWYFATLVRTRANLTRATRRAMWVMVFPILAVIMRILTVWR